MKAKLNDDELAARARAIFSEILQQGRTPTVEIIARTLKTGRKRTSDAMKKAGIMSQGLASRAKRMSERVRHQPCLDIVGLHAQGEVNRVFNEDGETLEPSLLVAVVVAGKGFPDLKETKYLRSAMEDLLAPSLVSSDKIRITQFETIIPDLLGTLDDPIHPQLSGDEFIRTVIESIAIKDEGYSILVLLHATGRAKAMRDALLPSFSEVDHLVWDFPLEHLMGKLATDKDIACLGAGFFPLMGSTVERMERALSDSKPCSTFNLTWSAKDIDAAVMARLSVCDRLAETGFLYGAPQTKRGEMANRSHTPISHELLARDYIYSDGLQSRELGKAEVGLTLPTRILPKLLRQLDVDCKEWGDTIGVVKHHFNGKEVECLVAWLPSMQKILFSALQQNKLDKIHHRWIVAQSECIEKLGDVVHPRCTEIVNREGLMQLGASSKSSGLNRDLILGLLITSYDSDFLVRHLMSEANRKEYRTQQNRWLGLIVKQLEQEANHARILTMSGFGHRGAAEEALNTYLLHLKKYGSRLIRFIIEQAAINFSQKGLFTARKLGLNLQQLPDERALSKEVIATLQQKLTNYWPVVGIRIDYLLKRAAWETWKRACYRGEKDKERGKIERDHREDKQGSKVKINKQFREIYHDMNFDDWSDDEEPDDQEPEDEELLDW